METMIPCRGGAALDTRSGRIVTLAARSLVCRAPICLVLVDAGAFSTAPAPQEPAVRARDIWFAARADRSQPFGAPRHQRSRWTGFAAVGRAAATP
jgi:hypothetical protein